MTVEIEDRKGWKYAVIRRLRGRGRAIRRALGTQSETEARDLVRDGKLAEAARADAADALLADVWTRMLAGRRVRVRDAVSGYQQHRSITGHPTHSIAKEQTLLAQFLRHAGGDLPNQPIAAVTGEQVAAFVNRPGEAKLSTRTWQLQMLNGWLDWAVAQRWIVRNPALDVIVRLDALTQEQLVSNPHVAFTEDEVRRLLAAVPRSDFWHGAIRFGYEYGLTIGSVALLEEGNVVANRLRAYRTKGRRLVNELLSDELVAWLEEWQAHRPASELPYLFPAEAADYLADPSILSKRFKRLCMKHGIEGRTFHGLRKTAVRKRLSAEFDELGDKDKRALMKLVLDKGFRRVQELLAHAPGSDVTEKHYLPQTSPP